MKTLENITVTRVHSVFTPMHKSGTHQHIDRRFSYAVSFSLGGRIIYRHGGEETLSDENSVIIHPMGESYDFTCTHSGAFAVVNFFTTHFFTDKFIKVEVDPQKITPLFTEIRELVLHGGTHHRIMRLFYEMLEFLTDAYDLDGGDILHLAKKEIKTSYLRPTFTVGALAEKIHVSESYLRRVFTVKLGVSPKKYLIDLRISYAKRLLSESNKSVGQIAESSGFSGVYHFCRAFREAVGITPTEYRKRSSAPRPTPEMQM